MRLILVLCVDIWVGLLIWKYQNVVEDLRKTNGIVHGPPMDLIEAAGSYGGKMNIEDNVQTSKT